MASRSTASSKPMAIQVPPRLVNWASTSMATNRHQAGRPADDQWPADHTSIGSYLNGAVVKRTATPSPLRTTTTRLTSTAQRRLSEHEHHRYERWPAAKCGRPLGAKPGRQERRHRTPAISRSNSLYAHDNGGGSNGSQRLQQPMAVWVELNQRRVANILQDEAKLLQDLAGGQSVSHALQMAGSAGPRSAQRFERRSSAAFHGSG